MTGHPAAPAPPPAPRRELPSPARFARMKEARPTSHCVPAPFRAARLERVRRGLGGLKDIAPDEFRGTANSPACRQATAMRDEVALFAHAEGGARAGGTLVAPARRLSEERGGGVTRRRPRVGLLIPGGGSSRPLALRFGVGWRTVEALRKQRLRARRGASSQAEPFALLPPMIGAAPRKKAPAHA